MLCLDSFVVEEFGVQTFHGVFGESSRSPQYRAGQSYRADTEQAGL